jgi:hypothetical protein
LEEPFIDGFSSVIEHSSPFILLKLIDYLYFSSMLANFPKNILYYSVLFDCPLCCAFLILDQYSAGRTLMNLSLIFLAVSFGILFPFLTSLSI